MKMVNVGCGTVYHASWINLDKYAYSPAVMSWDILQGLPFPDASVHVVYHSHLIEHLPPHDAERLLREACRVLKPGGVMRVVTPDLAGIARLYLEKFADALSNKPGADAAYEWMTLELFDQLARHERGGEMGRFLRRADLPARDFVRMRIGPESELYWNEVNASEAAHLWQKIKRTGPRVMLQWGRNTIAKSFVRVLAGREAMKAFECGLFRSSGEIHFRLYDRYSLQKLLASAGFATISVCRADESRIPDFNTYGLDMVSGEIRKPDSLFMEGIKP